MSNDAALDAVGAAFQHAVLGVHALLSDESWERFSLVLSSEDDVPKVTTLMAVHFDDSGTPHALNVSVEKKREFIDPVRTTTLAAGQNWIKCLIHGDADGRVRILFESDDPQRWEFDPEHLEEFIASLQPELT